MIKKQLYLFCLLCLLPLGAAAQTSGEIDSLKKILPQVNDTSKVITMNLLAFKLAFLNTDQSMDYAQKAIRLSESIHYQAGLARALNIRGVVYGHLAVYDSALYYFLQSLQLMKQLGHQRGIAIAMNNIGEMYQKGLGDPGKALIYHFKSLQIKQEINNQQGVIASYNNIGHSYSALGKYQQALSYYQQALELQKKLATYQGRAKTLSGIGNVYKKQQKYEQAMDYYRQSLESAAKEQDSHELMNTLADMGETQYLLGEYNQVLVYLQQILDLSPSFRAKDVLEKTYRLMSQVYEKKERPAESLHYYRLAVAYKDSVNNESVRGRIGELQISHRLESQQKEIVLLNEQNKHQGRLLLLMLGSLSVLLILAFLLYRSKRGLSTSNRELAAKNQEINRQKEAMALQARELSELNESITAKNTELEQLTEEIAAQRDNISEQKQQLEKTYSNIQVLSKIGMEITATLDLEEILDTVYQHINQLMDADTFGIGIYHPEEQEIEFQLAIEAGKRYTPYRRDMRDKNQFAVWCIENKKEIMIDDVNQEYRRYLSHYKNEDTLLEDGSVSGKPVAMLYCPLLVKGRALGVVGIHSFRPAAYTELHLEMLRTLAAYTAIALDNAQTYRKLDQAMQQLKNTQAQLVQSEKMASLGQLTAGIAHEINNPVNFIYAGTESLKTNFAEIMEVLDAYCLLSPGNSSEQLPRIEALKEEIQLAELRSETSSLLGSICRGAERTAEIVRGLRTFSRLDEDTLKMVDLHENIDATLVMLRNQYKDRIEIVQNYGLLPPVECYPGKLNQVFMNILSNAMQAIKGPGQIQISTSLHNNRVHIAIRDSGSGMSQQVKQRIFEPFFTTKEVGEGTGLGLSISHSIIEKHKGSIEVESQEGQGTCFNIYIPVKH